MKIEIEDNTLILKDVFNGIAIETREGKRLYICLRDFGFDVKIDDTNWHHINDEDDFFNTWIDFTTNPPKQEDLEVIGFNELWIHPDFNPEGTRVGFMGGEGFISAKWVDYQDCYVEDSETNPTKWIKFNK